MEKITPRTPLKWKSRCLCSQHVLTKKFLGHLKSCTADAKQLQCLLEDEARLVKATKPPGEVYCVNQDDEVAPERERVLVQILMLHQTDARITRVVWTLMAYCRLPWLSTPAATDLWRQMDANVYMGSDSAAALVVGYLAIIRDLDPVAANSFGSFFQNQSHRFSGSMFSAVVPLCLPPDCVRRGLLCAPDIRSFWKTFILHHMEDSDNIVLLYKMHFDYTDLAESDRLWSQNTHAYGALCRVTTRDPVTPLYQDQLQAFLSGLLPRGYPTSLLELDTLERILFEFADKEFLAEITAPIVGKTLEMQPPGLPLGDLFEIYVDNTWSGHSDMTTITQLLYKWFRYQVPPVDKPCSRVVSIWLDVLLGPDAIEGVPEGFQRLYKVVDPNHLLKLDSLEDPPLWQHGFKLVEHKTDVEDRVWVLHPHMMVQELVDARRCPGCETNYDPDTWVFVNNCAKKKHHWCGTCFAKIVQMWPSCVYCFSPFAELQPL